MLLSCGFAGLLERALRRGKNWLGGSALGLAFPNICVEMVRGVVDGGGV